MSIYFATNDYMLSVSLVNADYIRVLRRAGVDQKNLLKVYLCTVRPVLEYAVPIWQNIPDYLSKEMESVQKRALKIIFSKSESYAEDLDFVQLPTLSTRNSQICQKCMARMRRENHPLLPIPVVPDHDIILFLTMILKSALIKYIVNFL